MTYGQEKKTWDEAGNWARGRGGENKLGGEKGHTLLKRERL